MRDFIIDILVKLKLYIPVVHIINLFQHEVSARNMKKYALPALCAIDEAFTSIGVQVFPVFGTLLGAYRDHGFIPYDPDIDVSVIYNTLPNNYHNVLAKYGFKLVKQNIVRIPKMLIEETYEYKTIHVDIFFCFQDGDTFKFYGARKHEFKDWKTANQSDGFPVACQYVDKCDFIRQDFLGHQILMPIKAKEWLVDMYTDTFMTPIKNFDDNNKKRRVDFPTGLRSYRENLTI